MRFHILMILLIKMTIAWEWLPNPKWRGNTPVVWVDGRNRAPGAEIDTFFDRVIIISHKIDSTSKQYHNVVTGVLITTRLILTSFNSFKLLSQKNTLRDGLRVTFLKDRLFNKSGNLTSYFLDHDAQARCARQIVPTFDQDVSDYMRHGPFCPLHDLMVIGVEEEIELLLPIPPPVTEFKDTNEGKWDDSHNAHVVQFGPILTDVANEDDKFTDNLKFVSLGHINERHIKESRFLEKQEIFSDDDAIIDCDEWLPREWGYFLCIRNVNELRGLASGGMLFSEGKLFGVGSFALWRGKESILVFTDIRPYSHLLFNTCTEDDQNLVKG